METALVLLSGGLDSTTLLADTIETLGIDNVAAISFDYGQKHGLEEGQAANRIAKYYEVPLIRLNFRDVFSFSSSALLCGNKEILQGSYAEQLSSSDTLNTEVEFRNGLFISAATSIAMAKGYELVLYGAHAGDANYPDCTLEFFMAMNTAVSIGTRGKVTIRAPYINWTKINIARRAVTLGVPIGMTWSCYKGIGETPCGACATCIEREEALKAAGWKHGQ